MVAGLYLDDLNVLAGKSVSDRKGTRMICRSDVVAPVVRGDGERGPEWGPGVEGVGPGGIDQPRAAAAIRELLLAIGEDPDREGLRETPARVARAYAHLFGGLRQSPARHLARVFHEPAEGPVLVRDIRFHSMCEHHLLPFMGRAHVAYLPAEGRIVGLSKVARTVEVYARRPQVQERLTGQIADALEERLSPQGVLVVVEARHMCMEMRGVSSPEAVTVTMAARGVYRVDAAARRELQAMMSGGAG